MDIQISRTDIQSVAPLRQRFLEAHQQQFILDKAYTYGWADPYAFFVGDRLAGYGSVWGTNKREDRDTIFEFYLEPLYRRHSDLIFSRWIQQGIATLVEVQTNDPFLAPPFFRHTQHVRAEAILFRDSYSTHLQPADAIFTRNTIRQTSGFDEGDFIVMYMGEVVASGGLMLNYNFPYADIYMNVKEAFRDRGFGSFIVQELKKYAYEIGRVPAARCNIDNTISRATLFKAGFEICGYRMTGEIKAELLRA